MSWAKVLLAVLLVPVVAALALVASSRDAAAVVIRNTPQLAGVARALPAPSIVRSVAPTAGDPGQTGAMYVPNGQGQWPGILLVNGAEVPGGWRSPDVETFARSIADLGLTVYVPDLPGFEQGALSVRALSALEADLDGLTRSPYVSGGRASLVGICVGASLGLLAAAQPEIAGQVRSVAAIDPYASLRDAIEAATVGRAPGLDGRPGQFHMEPWVRADAVRSLASTIAEPSRGAILDALAAGASSDPLQGFRREPPRLDPTGAAWWRLLGNTDPEAFDRLYGALPEAVRNELEALSPASSIGRVEAPVLIAAPYHDFAFPPGEATILERGNPSHVRVTRTSALDHVTPTLGPSVLAGYWRLWRFAGEAIDALR